MGIFFAPIIRRLPQALWKCTGNCFIESLDGCESRSLILSIPRLRFYLLPSERGDNVFKDRLPRVRICSGCRSAGAVFSVGGLFTSLRMYPARNDALECVASSCFPGLSAGTYGNLVRTTGSE